MSMVKCTQLWWIISWQSSTVRTMDTCNILTVHCTMYSPKPLARLNDTAVVTVFHVVLQDLLVTARHRTHHTNWLTHIHTNTQLVSLTCTAHITINSTLHQWLHWHLHAAQHYHLPLPLHYSHSVLLAVFQASFHSQKECLGTSSMLFNGPHVLRVVHPAVLKHWT